MRGLAAVIKCVVRDRHGGAGGAGACGAGARFEAKQAQTHAAFGNIHCKHHAWLLGHLKAEMRRKDVGCDGNGGKVEV